MQNWGLWLCCLSWGAWQDPFFWERKKLITLAAVRHRNLIVSTLVNRSYRIFCCCCFFGVLLKGRGAGRDSFQFCIKTKFTHAFYSIVIALSVCHWTPVVDALGNGGLWQVLWWLGHVLFKNKNTKHRNLPSAYQGKQPFHDSRNTLQCTSLQIIFPFFFFLFLFLLDAAPTHRESLICKLEVFTMPYRA